MVGHAENKKVNSNWAGSVKSLSLFVFRISQYEYVEIAADKYFPGELDPALLH